MSLRLLGSAPPAMLVDRFYDPIGRVALVWVAISRHYPVEITSWWRSWERNASTRGSARYSQHLLGTAMDGRVRGMTREQLLAVVQPIAAYFGVTAPAKPSESSGSSVHVQALPIGMAEKIIRRDPGIFDAAAGFVGPPRPIA